MAEADEESDWLTAASRQDHLNVAHAMSRHRQRHCPPFRLLPEQVRSDLAQIHGDVALLLATMRAAAAAAGPAGDADQAPFVVEHCLEQLELATCSAPAQCRALLAQLDAATMLIAAVGDHDRQPLAAAAALRVLAHVSAACAADAAAAAAAAAAFAAAGALMALAGVISTSHTETLVELACSGAQRTCSCPPTIITCVDEQRVLAAAVTGALEAWPRSAGVQSAGLRALRAPGLRPHAPAHLCVQLATAALLRYGSALPQQRLHGVARAHAAATCAEALHLLRALLSDGAAAPSAAAAAFIAADAVAAVTEALEWHAADVPVLVAGWQAVHAACLLVHRVCRHVPKRARAPYTTLQRAGRCFANTTRQYNPAAIALNQPTTSLQLQHYAAPLSSDAAMWRLLEDEAVHCRLAELAVRAGREHPRVAPLQWRCLAAVCALQEVCAGAGKEYAARGGLQQLARVLAEELEHAALVEQAARLVAQLARSSFTARSTLGSHGCAAAVRRALYLHRAHRGVQALGARALAALREAP
ncbi:hypothetical protein JKP88DRAFT_324474 [Tribonema minus]|uniref:Uncharacterized protein n=1 Tax=Tribonema minus TaxID=303371 RepID=A0A836CCS9_9STRA|nr:hypothetical protein JKP88DRAFT_324474 [Tribonema minus]